MSAISQYEAIKVKIDEAITQALVSMVRPIADSLEESAYRNVYTYQASPMAMDSRRYSFLNIAEHTAVNIDKSTHTLTMTTKVTLQSGFNDDEVNIVESGDPTFRQPGPRPFMDQGLETYVASGAADVELARALYNAGFDVTMS